MGGSFLGWVEGPPVLVSTPVVHWPVIGAVLFVDTKGEPSCLFTVVTRRGWCGSGSMLRQHEVCVRTTDAQGRVRTERFRVQPTLAGLGSLSNRLAEAPPEAWRHRL
jgi:hypothetical protein